MSEVILNNLEKVYPNGFKAVHGIDLDVKDGEFMVLIGPSGCSKSTTLRMIAGLESVSGGEITIGGKIVNNLPPYDRGIAMVFQNYALYPHMKVHKNLSFGLRLARQPKEKIQESVDHVSGMLQIEELLERLPKQLSGGQAQRVAVGRALIKKPEVFLFDEPLSNLDAKLRASMRIRITELHRTLKEQGLNATVIYVTHDQTEAMTMGDRICVLRDGHIMQVDTPTRLYDYPDNSFVAGFLGSPEMNLKSAKLIRNGGQPALRIGNATVALPESKSRCLLDQPEGEVTLGIRPPFIDLVAPDEEGAVVDATIKFIEFMGHEVFIYFDLDGEEYSAVNRIENRALLHSLKGGEKARFRFDLERAHIFENQTKKNLTLSNHV
jgi:oligogalacturonide transport system ATP-binding protein